MDKLTIPTAEPFFYSGGKTGCLLVHGFTGSPKEMELMGKFLSKKGITSMGIRLAGHATQANDMIRTRWKDWLASVEDGFNFLSGICENIFIAGLSMGGLLTLLAASSYPINGAIAMATPYSISSDWRVTFAKQISFIFPFVKKEQSDKGNKNKEREHISYHGYPTRSIAELKDLIDTLHQESVNISIPILFINSKQDRTAPPDHAEKYCGLIKSKDIIRLTLEKSEHVITEGIERDIAFNAALDFIRKHSKS